MYPITNAVKALFESEQRQVLRITGTDANGNAINITEANVMEGGFNIDRSCINGTRIEIGTAIASEMKLTLDNRQGQFNGIQFEGTELFVEIGIADWTQENPTVTYIPCGYFTPYEQPRSLNQITLYALDRMTKFDAVPPILTPWTTETGEVITDNNDNVIYFLADLSFPTTVADLINQVCVRCLVPFSQILTSFPNYNYTITAMPVLQQEVTFRNIIQWCAGLMGTNAYVDWNGNLFFSWYDNTTGYSSTTSTRYNSDLYENAIVITGVEFSDPNSENNTIYLAGTDTYTLDLSGNCLINAQNANTVLQAIYTKVHDFAYTPFSAEVVCAPYLWPMDRVTFTDKNGIGHVSSLTNVNFGINGGMAIESSGETTEYNKAIKPNPFTALQENVLRNIQHLTSAEISFAVEDATAQITGAEGGYVRFIYDANDKLTEIVIMDTEDITTATKVWRWNSGGLGYSSNGYAGPYTTAITQNGAIVADFITVGTMIADRIKGGMLTLGGSNNVNGQMQVLDSNNNVIGTWDSNGITLNKGAISGPSVILGGNNNASGILTVKDSSGNTIGTWDNTGIHINNGEILANVIKGGTLTLGGINNEDGDMQILDANGNQIVTLNNTGANINDGSIISYSADRQARAIFSAGLITLQYYDFFVGTGTYEWLDKAQLSVTPITVSGATKYRTFLDGADALLIASGGAIDIRSLLVRIGQGSSLASITLDNNDGIVLEHSWTDGGSVKITLSEDNGVIINVRPAFGTEKTAVTIANNGYVTINGNVTINAVTGVQINGDLYVNGTIHN